MLAEHAADHPAPDVSDLEDPCDKEFAGVRLDEVRGGQRDAAPRPRDLDQAVQGSRGLELRVPLEAPAHDADGLAVEGHRRVVVAARPVSPELARAAQEHLPGAGELDLLQRRRDRPRLRVRLRRPGLVFVSPRFLPSSLSRRGDPSVGVYQARGSKTQEQGHFGKTRVRAALNPSSGPPVGLSA